MQDIYDFVLKVLWPVAILAVFATSLYLATGGTLPAIVIGFGSFVVSIPGAVWYGILAVITFAPGVALAIALVLFLGVCAYMFPLSR